ncbi:MAG: hypothetical protein JWO99_585 [Candidatus Saccharibacteria bacterium]|nr:hypothetical protein [Candidatus Saccharibacteria bacterium]
MHHLLRHGKRIGTAIVGGLVVLIGLILIPYPGPGWLIVFAGFAVLATEFEFAAKWLAWLRGKYATWTSWLKRQHPAVKIGGLLLAGLVILATVYLLNTFGAINRLFHLDQTWLISPFFR